MPEEAIFFSHNGNLSFPHCITSHIFSVAMRHYLFVIFHSNTFVYLQLLNNLMYQCALHRTSFMNSNPETLIRVLSYIFIITGITLCFSMGNAFPKIVLPHKQEMRVSLFTMSYSSCELEGNRQCSHLLFGPIFHFGSISSLKTVIFAQSRQVMRSPVGRLYL